MAPEGGEENAEEEEFYDGQELPESQPEYFDVDDDDEEGEGEDEDEEGGGENDAEKTQDDNEEEGGGEGSGEGPMESGADSGGTSENAAEGGGEGEMSKVNVPFKWNYIYNFSIENIKKWQNSIFILGCAEGNVCPKALNFVSPFVCKDKYWWGTRPVRNSNLEFATQFVMEGAYVEGDKSRLSFLLFDRLSTVGRRDWAKKWGNAFVDAFEKKSTRLKSHFPHRVEENVGPFCATPEESVAIEGWAAKSTMGDMRFAAKSRSAREQFNGLKLSTIEGTGKGQGGVDMYGVFRPARLEDIVAEGRWKGNLFLGARLRMPDAHQRSTNNLGMALILDNCKFSRHMPFYTQ